MPDQIEELKQIAHSDVKWDPADKPIVVADGRAYPVSELAAPLEAASAYVVGIGDKHFARLCRHLRAPIVYFYEMRVQDLSPLSELAGLRQLAICWNTKAEDLAPLADCSSLCVLLLENVPKAYDLSPMAKLADLRALEFSGGIWSKNRAHTLAPLAALPRLEELHLTNLVVDRDGLRPLAGCQALKRLRLSNQFLTEDYAYLAAKLPGVECDMLAPYIKLSSPIEGKDTMVVGKGKPLLDSRTDGERLAEYVRRFEALRRDFGGRE